MFSGNSWHWVDVQSTVGEASEPVGEFSWAGAGGGAPHHGHILGPSPAPSGRTGSGLHMTCCWGGEYLSKGLDDS